jgi:hypothetical protein
MGSSTKLTTFVASEMSIGVRVSPSAWNPA